MYTEALIQEGRGWQAEAELYGDSANKINTKGEVSHFMFGQQVHI